MRAGAVCAVAQVWIIIMVMHMLLACLVPKDVSHISETANFCE